MVRERWWRQGIVYQIYPLSFMDSDGDGFGDLDGIRSRLDYVKFLGVDAIWLSPIYPSPWRDFGYDVSDYTSVHPVFGTLEDFDALLADVHRRGLRLILDLVPNHTSDEHPWFEESRSSRDNPRRDWYIWRDPAPDGGVPNNWVSYFGSAWEFDERTGQFYFHQFRKEQPELNYRNPAVLEAMLDVMRFWLDRGVDGFRVDVIALLAKDDRFLNEPPNPAYTLDQMNWHSLHHIYTEGIPYVHEIVRAMRAVLDEYDDRVMLGELDPIRGLMDFYGAELDECHLPFNFHLLTAPWQAALVRKIADNYDAALPTGAWPTWVLGNHDRRRIASRIGVAQARLAQMLLLTLRGTPICYYGDEIGMTEVAVPLEKRRDLPTGDETHSRDGNWTPMRWDRSPNAGFCPPGVTPWLPVGEGTNVVNVAAEIEEPRSMLTLYRRLAELRRRHNELSVGSYRSLEAGNRDVFAYERRDGASSLVVALNFSDATQTADLGAVAAVGEISISTHLDRIGAESLASLRLRAGEGVLFRPCPRGELTGDTD